MRNPGPLGIGTIGTEVLVDFMEGDMDRPVVVACLYNGADLPPYSAGVDANTNHPGTLSGLHSHGLAHDNTGSQDYNQWVIDDTQHQLRMRLASSTAATQLNLGHLIHQSPTSAQRGAYRGQGFELRTDAWAAVRGADGLFLTTTQRPGLGASVTSTQMDAAEAVAQMKAAQALAKVLCDAATHQTALSSKNAQTAQSDLIKTLDPAQQGKYTSAVNGQPAQKTQPGTRDLDPTQPVEKFATPLILMDSPTTINWATSASTALFAGQHLHWTSQTDLHLTAAHTLAGVSGHATTLFTHDGGIQAIAANGPVSLQAHTDQLDILADDSVTVTSVNGDIEVKAQQKIVLQADGASITLEGANITLACSGSTSVKGAVHGFEGAMREEVGVEGLPVGAVSAANFAVPGAPSVLTPDISPQHFDEQIQFRNAKQAPLARINYTLRLADSSTHAGVTDDQGRTQRITTATPQAITHATLQPSSLQSCCAVHAENTQGAAEPLEIALTDIETNAQDIGSSVRQVKPPEGKSRGLTVDEIAMARLIFKDSIDYTKVKVHNGEYLWFGVQPDDTAMTPEGEMYFNKGYFKEDFSLSTFGNQLWFMHEMVHVWQYLSFPRNLVFQG